MKPVIYLLSWLVGQLVSLVSFFQVSQLVGLVSLQCVVYICIYAYIHICIYIYIYRESVICLGLLVGWLVSQFSQVVVLVSQLVRQPGSQLVSQLSQCEMCNIYIYIQPVFFNIVGQFVYVVSWLVRWLVSQLVRLVRAKFVISIYRKSVIELVSWVVRQFSQYGQLVSWLVCQLV